MSDERSRIAGDRFPPLAVSAGGVPLRRGNRVRITPSAGRDWLDLVLSGREARVQGIEQDDAGRVRVAVTLDDARGGLLDDDALLGGHSFHFDPAQLALVAASPRILVGGLGDVFLGDDGFGVEVVRRLGSLGPDVDAIEFGIRGMELVRALERGYAGVVLVHAQPRGAAPGTLSVSEPDLRAPAQRAGASGRGFDPLQALRLARALGAELGPLRVVTCEPTRIAPGFSGELAGHPLELSGPLRTALPLAVDRVTSLVAELRTELPERTARAV